MVQSGTSSRTKPSTISTPTAGKGSQESNSRNMPSSKTNTSPTKTPSSVPPPSSKIAPAAEAPATKPASSSGTIYLKIVSLAVQSSEEDEDGAPAGPSLSKMPLITLEFQNPSVQALRSETRLSDIRTKLESVLKSKQAFKFCTDDCSVVPENTLLDAYYGMLSAPRDASAGLEVFVAAAKQQRATQGAILLKPPFMLKFISMGDTPSNATNVGSVHSSSFKGKDPTPMPLGELRRLIGKMSSSPSVHIFCALDGSAAGDELSLQEYLALDAEGVHEVSGTPSVIIRYRKADAKISAAASKFHGATPEVLAALEQMKPDLTFRDRSGQELQMDTSSFKVQEELSASQFAARDANPGKFTSQMDESDWDHVLRNCCLLYGWRINKKTNTIERAQTPAFKLRNNIPLPPPIAAKETDVEPPTGQAIEASSSQSENEDNTPPGSESGSLVSTSAQSGAELKPSALTAEDVAAPIPPKLGAIPSYAINDRSRIEVTNVTSEFQESMAKNHFSSSSVEANVSGGYGPVSGGVTGGVASESSSGQSSSNKSFGKKMIANYMFPRVSVFLRPEDLEPTAELRESIDLVRKTKNINALRNLYSTFGHLFCHQVTLGGCLQTTKTVSGTENTSTSQQKESFKASVGVAVSSPWVTASVKASHETQDSSQNHQSNTQTSEAMTFEATGGNTILAADPPAWSGSVADFNNWRVIEQSELTPIIDALAGIRGYSMVKTWFYRAVPTLSQYLVIPASRILHARFRVTSEDASFQRLSGREAEAYLGHDPSAPPKHIRTSLERKVPEMQIHQNISYGPWGPVTDLTVNTIQVEVTNTDAMFFPYSVQAPTLMFPGGDDVGTLKDPKLKQTVWRLEIAQGYSLGVDSLVCLKSLSQDGANMQLNVYRNQQGVFLPSMTSTDEPCFWRFERAYSTSKDEKLKHGEVLRLTWRFSDQAGGFRNYCDDTYGRRTFGRPAGIATDTLYMKVPYPRFENAKSETGISIVMSAAATKDPIVEKIKVRPTGSAESGTQEINYNLHDLTFRLDHVGNNGIGDAADYMNVNAEGHSESYQTKILNSASQHTEPPMQTLMNSAGPEAIIAGALLGPVAAPIAAIGSILGSIFDF